MSASHRTGSLIVAARNWIKMALVLITLPLAGVVFVGKPWQRYLAFPPLTEYVSHAGFSPIVFVSIGIVDLLLVAGLILTIIWSPPTMTNGGSLSHKIFPWWGWIGVLIIGVGWLLAWSRFEWFQAFQKHTFTLPWIGYILTVNALCWQRSGSSPLTCCPLRFIAMFPTSAFFWWFFEYLNRFVQNWYYAGVADFGPLAYIFFASLAFTTVLPAVLSTYALILTFPRFGLGLTSRTPLALLDRKEWAIGTLIIAAAGLAGVGIWPDHLFPLVWMAPLLVLTSLQTLTGQRTIFTPLARGDYHVLVAAPLAGLICGFFWELWNLHSLAKWHYTIPFVDRWHLFEMPLLGYGGYLPFGLECLAIGALLMPQSTPDARLR